MSLFGKQPDRTVAQLVADARAARGRKDQETCTRLMRRAADTLLVGDHVDEAIELLAKEREYATAAEICEKKKDDWTRAAKLWFRAGNFVRSAKALVKNGEDAAAIRLLEDAKEYAEAARIHERLKNFVKASALFERAGEKLDAANALVQLLRGEEGKRISKAELQTTCQKAAALYTEAGELERAAKILRWAGQEKEGAELLIKSGKPDAAIALLRNAGKHQDAADVAHSTGDVELSERIKAEYAEKAGELTDAAAHYEKARAYPEAARMYEFAGDYLRAAQSAERAGDLPSAAALYEKQGRLDEAARCLRAAGKEEEADELLARNSGPESEVRELATHGDHLNAAIGFTSLARKGDRSHYGSAIEHLVQVAPDSPEYLQAQTMLAEVYGEMGDRNRGIDILQKILRGVTPTAAHVPAIYLRGRLLELEGYLAAAREHYKTAAGIDPSFMDVSKRLSMLQTRAASVAQSEATPSSRLPSVAIKTGDSTRRTPIDGTRRPPAEAIRGTPPPPLAFRSESPDATPSPYPVADATTRGQESLENTVLRPSNLVGVVLRGRFRIERRVGVGGQAQVYLARDVVLDRPVAIKVLNEHIASDSDAIERFLREARYAARVHHPKCIAVFDFGQERGLTFMAMEYFDGTTLRERLKQGALPLEDALRIGCGVAEALMATHSQGIIHRDVKPSNIMVNMAGDVRLADFGVARNRDAETSARGMMVGSMAYMPPEQANGKEADGRADVFSLGAVLYEMLSGERPFESTIEGLVARVDRPPPMLPEKAQVPERLRWMIRRAMQPKRDDRYPSMDLFLADLKPVLDDLAPSRALDLAMTSLLPAEPSSALENAMTTLMPAGGPHELENAATALMPPTPPRAVLENAATALMPPTPPAAVLENAATALMPPTPPRTVLENAATTLMPPPPSPSALEGSTRLYGKGTLESALDAMKPSALETAQTRLYPATTLESALHAMGPPPSALENAETRAYPAATLKDTLASMAPNPLENAATRVGGTWGLESAQTTYGSPWGLESERLVSDLIAPTTPPPPSSSDTVSVVRKRIEGDGGHGLHADNGDPQEEGEGPDEVLWQEPTP